VGDAARAAYQVSAAVGERHVDLVDDERLAAAERHRDERRAILRNGEGDTSMDTTQEIQEM
jgi:hypothetical protein